MGSWRIPAALLSVAVLLSTALWVKNERAPAGWADATPELQAVMWPVPRPVDDFHLVTHSGDPFGPEEFHGAWNFVFFGYLSCPDVCPLTLYSMRRLREYLRATTLDADDHQFVFVSVDPEVDSPRAIGEYLAFHDTSFIGLTGTPGQVATLVDAMSVMVRPVAVTDEVRLIDHTASIIVVDPRGRAVASFSPPHDPESMAILFEALRAHLRVR